MAFTNISSLIVGPILVKILRPDIVDNREEAENNKIEDLFFLIYSIDAFRHGVLRAWSRFNTKDKFVIMVSVLFCVFQPRIPYINHYLPFIIRFTMFVWKESQLS